MHTIKDVAKDTGLGLATISKYLNGGNVRPENKILIENSIEKLGYTVNVLARGLKTNKSKIIGILIPELSNLFITTVITIIEDILRQQGYGILVCDCRSNPKLEKELVNFLISKQVDGIINMPVCTDGSHLVDVMKKNIPTVLIDRKIKNDNVDYVGVNNILAGEIATNKLIDAGHKNIAVLTGPKILSTATERLLGYEKAMEEANLPVKQSNKIYAGYSIEGGYKFTKQIIEADKDISAIFCTNYELTIGCIIALNEMGLKIAEDVSLIGFDSIELTKIVNPKLTIIAQPVHELATHTAQLMLKKLDGNLCNSQIILSPYIEEGKSIKEIKGVF